MKKIAIVSLMIVVTVLCLRIDSRAVQTQDISKALESGAIKILFEGMENENQIKLTISKLQTDKLMLLISKGITSFPFQGGKFSISLTKEMTVDLSKKNETQTTVPQAGENRIIKGSFSIQKGENGYDIMYHKGLSTIESIK